MARPGVTYLDVSNAAQQLIAAGRTPTIETIRIALGTGSNSTLGAHLRTWKSTQDKTQQIATQENIPEELIAALKGVWDRVINQSEDKIQSIQQETQQELTQLKQEVQSLQKDNAHWQQQHQQIKQERDGLVQEKLVVDQLLANSKVEIAALIEKISGFEQQSQEKQARIDELHRQNQQVQANLEHYRNASLEQRLAEQQRYEQQQKQLEQTIQQVNQTLTAVKQEKVQLQQQSHQASFENNRLKIQLSKLENQHGSMINRLTDALNELAKQTQAQQHWQEQYNTLLVKSDEQVKPLHELQTRCAVLAQQLETTKTELEELRENNKLLAHEKWALGQEKAQLHGQLKQLETYL
ncbi:DNA-binding protein [soil metagenome]